MRGYRKVSSKPALLHAEQAQLSQPVIHKRCSSPWSISVASSGLTTAVPHACHIEGPRLEGRTPGRVLREQSRRIPSLYQLPTLLGKNPRSQGFLGYQNIWPTYGHHCPQVLVSRAGVNLFVPQLVFIWEVAGIQVLGCLCCIHHKQEVPQAITQQRETHEALKTWVTFVVFKNFPGLLK